MATRALVFAILAMSVDLLLGFVGLASLGQAAYFSVGAYLTAILATKYNFGLGWDFWLVVLLGMLIGAATAAFFGLFAVRASGVYFLMITLALSQCVWGLAYRWNSLTGGDNGINVTARPSFGLDLTNERTFFFLVFGFFAATLLALYILVRSPFGRSLEGIRERELRMRILGYNTWLHKYIAFIIAGAVGGLAGVLWAHTNGLVSPDTAVLTTSVDALLMVVLGGAGTLVGGAIGSAIVFGLREYLSTLVPWWQYVLGRRLRADDLVSADGVDGASGAASATPRSARHQGRNAGAGETCSLAFRIVRWKHKQYGRNEMTIRLRRPTYPTLLAGMPGARLEHQRAGPGGRSAHRLLAPTTGFLSQTGQDMEHGFETLSQRPRRHARRRQSQLHRRGHAGQARRRGHQGQEAGARRTMWTCSSAACWPRPATRWRRSAPKRRRSTFPLSPPPTI